MPKFYHKRTGKIIDVDEGMAHHYENRRYTRLPEPSVPDGTVAEILAWVGDDEHRAEEALQAELAGKRRKSLVDRLT